MTPLPHNTRRLEQNIVRTLLEVAREVTVAYPAELYQPRRDAYIAQVDTVKQSRPGLQTGAAGSRQNEGARKAY